jgi:hypothetical protein
MTCCSIQAEDETKKKVEAVEEVDPQEAFRQLVLDGKGTCCSLILYMCFFYHVFKK